MQMPDIESLEFETRNSGLKVHKLEEGDGAVATAGRTVEMHYTGWLTDGTQFDSSVERDQPFAFPLGKGHVIAGWEEGVQGMKEGGKQVMILPPELGYGNRPIGPIPAGSTLVFQVELLKVFG